MKRRMSHFICWLVLLAGTASAQELVITDFPLGVGGSVSEELFKTHSTELQAIADTLQKYPLARAIITGGADGNEYRRDHDAKNPGLALGRAHILRALLIAQFNVDSTQLVIQSQDGKVKGPQYRFASIRIDRELADLDARVKALEAKPPVEKHFTEVKEVTPVAASAIENFGLQLGAGVTTTPYGGTPMVATAITWKRVVFLEAFAGHTLWKGEFTYLGDELKTKRRIIGGQLIVFPLERIPVGVVGGWARIEELSQEYYEYVHLSEGPQFGLRVTPLKFLSATATFNPAKHRTAARELAESNYDQFLFSLIAHIGLGGAK